MRDVLEAPGRKIIEDRDPMPLGQQSLGQM
jgi:hypothetical protein